MVLVLHLVDQGGAIAGRGGRLHFNRDFASLCAAS